MVQVRHPESYVESHSVTLMEKNGWLSVKCMKMSRPGWPDRQFHKNGRTVFVEYKATGKKPTALQLYIHKILRNHGFEVYWTDNPQFFVS